MAIKDRNGNVYKLRGPNPILEQQSTWDKSAVKLINIGKNCETISKKEAITEINENILVIREEKSVSITAENFIKEIVQPTEIFFSSEPEEIIKDDLTEVTQINVDSKLAKIIQERGIECFCAPAIGSKKHVDPLYGTTYQTTIYGEQFLFDAVIIDQSDLELQFWCIRPITLKSVILKKVKDGGERWWRVNHTEPKTGGYLVLCVISDSNPDFSQ